MQKFSPSIYLSRVRWALSALTVLLALMMTGTGLRAQSTQGSILGAVKDASGAVVPNATVTLTNADAGVVRTTKTSANGDYSFSDVQAARYAIEIEAPTFERWRTSGVVLAVRQELRLDATLTAGGVQQEVTVNADSATAIETDSPTISGVFTADDAANLPVNTRASFNGTSAYNILGTLPGMQADASGFSLQGALPYQTDVTIDGLTTKSTGGNSVLGD